jgi:hypothetical protein
MSKRKRGQVLANLEAVLSAGGSSLKSVVKTTIYLQSMNDFAAVNAVYSGSLLRIGHALRLLAPPWKLPNSLWGAQVEIEVIALVEGRRTKMGVVSLGELLIDFVALESGVSVGDASGFEEAGRCPRKCRRSGSTLRRALLLHGTSGE